MNKKQRKKLKKELRKDKIKAIFTYLPAIAFFAVCILFILLFTFPSSFKEIEGIAISQSYLQSGDNQGYTSMKVKLNSGKTIGVAIINHKVFEKGKTVIVNKESSLIGYPSYTFNRYKN